MSEVQERAREDALRPMFGSGMGFWVLTIALGLVALAGVGAWIYQIREGLGVAGYSDRAFWSIYEANLVTFIGVSYGGAVVSAILRLTRARWRAPITRLAEGTALASLIVGSMFAWIHLGRPERIWELVLHARGNSPIFWDFVAVGTYLLATAVFLYLPLIPDLALVRERLHTRTGKRSQRVYAFLARGYRGLPEQRRALSWAISAVAVLIIPLAVSVHSVLSWAFALTSRPGWHSTIFAPYFVVAALYSGVALVVLVTAGFRRGYHLHRHIHERHFVYLGALMATLGALYLYFTFSEFLTEGFVKDRSSAALLTQMLVGRYAVSFWLFMVAGVLVPILLVAVRRTRTVPGIVVAAGLAVAGMWLKRMLIVVPAANAPLIAGGWGAYHFTWVSITVTLGAVAAIPFLLLVLFRFVPVLSVSEIEELQEVEEVGERVGTAPTRVGLSPGLAEEGGGR